MNIGIVVAQEADFQILDQPAHLLFIHQQSRNCHQRHAIGGNAFGKIEFGKNLREATTR